MGGKNGTDNLIPFSERSKEEARESGRKGGIASGQARRRKADMKRLLEAALKMQSTDDGLTHAERITLSVLTIAGNPKYGGASVKAYERILKTLGQDIPEPEQQRDDPLLKLLGGIDAQSNSDG